MKITTSQHLEQLRSLFIADEARHKKKVIVCCGTGCLANGAAKLVEAFHSALKENNITDFSVEAVKETGCHGFCEQGPLVVIEPQGTI